MSRASAFSRPENSGLRLAPGIASALERHLLWAAPREACGVLIGTRDHDGMVVKRVLPSRTAPAFDAFELADFEIRRAAAVAGEHGLSIVGLYHSHDSGQSELSMADLAGIASSCWPWLVITRRGTGRIALNAYSPPDACRLKVTLGPGDGQD